jgi:hypothetical protein
MKSLNQFTKLIAALLCFLIFIFFLFSNNYSKEDERVILAAPTISKSTPIGEITNGIRIEQPINWSPVGNSEFNSSDNICINLLMANYGNRENDGTFSLTLKTENFSKKIIFNANAVKDNSYERFCYKNILLKDIVNKPAALVLEGINSPPSKAITVWMTSDTSRGKVTQGGIVLDSSLIFFINIISKPSVKNIQAIFLAILCGLSLLILFWPISVKPNERNLQ